MHVLVLLTNAYPFGTGEAFIEPEVPFLTAGFDQTVIVATQIRSDGRPPRALGGGVRVWAVSEPQTRRGRAAGALVGGLRALLSGDGGRLLSPGPGLAARRADAAFEARAQWCWGSLRRRVDELRLSKDDDVTVYSYWLHHTARVGELIAHRLRGRVRSVRFVSRAHGYDLYEERHPSKRIPQRKELLDALDAVYPVSHAGERYLRSRHPQASVKISTRHLGTLDPGRLVPEGREDVISIVSCAIVSPVKRLDRIPAIIERLAQTGLKVRWTHIGDGPGLEELARRAESTRTVAEVDLLGHMPHDSIPEFYRSLPKALFLSVSSSEGVPVSMMEALATGVPIISTDVGGVRDLVVPGQTGELLPGDFSDEEAAQTILRLWGLPEPGFGDYRWAARLLWEEEFSADRNYPRFIRDLKADR